MVKAKSIDYVHTGPGTLAGRYLREFWQPVCLAEELEVGRPKRIKALGEHFTGYRGTDGVARLVADTCPHRGTQLFLGWVEDDCIRCFYHGWKFDGSGQCVEQPGERESFARKIRIASYPTREYLGLVFAYLGRGEPPELQQFPELENEAQGRLMSRAVELPFNYFQRLENDHDTVHIHFVHKPGVEHVGLTDVPHIRAEETDYGFWQGAERPDGSVRASYCFMPNVLLTRVSLGADRMEDYATHLAWRVPIDDVTTRSYTINRLQSVREGTRREFYATEKASELAERILAGKARVQEMDPSLPYAFIVQDYVALSAQGAVADRSVERLGQSDLAIILLRKIYERELRKLAAGQRLKKWRRSGDSMDFGPLVRPTASGSSGIDSMRREPNPAR
jgi:5,5'-dehydrodivanillate O-demethylase oxygenase subunit